MRSTPLSCLVRPDHPAARALNMTTVAVLGWGSLVWDPPDLPIRRHWYEDGPFIKADFLRQSSDGRMRLVLDETGSEVRSLWA